MVMFSGYRNKRHTDITEAPEDTQTFAVSAYMLDSPSGYPLITHENMLSGFNREQPSPPALTQERVPALEPLHAPRPDDTDQPYPSDAMGTVGDVLRNLMHIDGAICGAVVDAGSATVLDMTGDPSFCLDTAAIGSADVVLALLLTMSNLGIADSLDDVLITLSSQYHLTCLIDTPTSSTLFVYLVLDRARANAALARRELGEQASRITI